MSDEVVFPEGWRLSPPQELVIGTFVDEPVKFHTPADFCEAIYGEEHKTAPAKLRVLMQRCREIVSDLTDGEAKIINKRGTGWKMSHRDAILILGRVKKDTE